MEDDFRHGQGKMTLMPNTLAEEVYEGEWDTDERHGYVLMTPTLVITTSDCFKNV